MSLIVKTFYGDIPEGKAAVRKNMVTSDNRPDNIIIVTKKEAGKRTGCLSDNHRNVVKIDKYGNPVEIYRSIREAGRRNHMSYQAISDRCHNKVKRPYESDGFNYQFEDKIFKY